MLSKKFPELRIGLSASVQKLITREDTALNFGSGALKELLATPTLTALMIEASVKAVDPLLPDRYITVGKNVSITHSHPTASGMTVTVTATLKEINRNRLLFQIDAFDELGPIGSGSHERYIVDYDAFMDKVKERCKPLEAKVK
ncbi:MAG: thioesterase [Peptococcaceae bacterium]|jgi:predicted thioesterase|nr:thioesterase [Peptococcaceae bacterium]MDH7525428.1 thioesterase [Peptococcaceae bacterium]